MGFLNIITAAAKIVWGSLRNSFSTTAPAANPSASLSGHDDLSALVAELVKNCEASLTFIASSSVLLPDPLYRVYIIADRATIPNIKSLQEKMELVPPPSGIMEALCAKVFALGFALFQLRRVVELKGSHTNEHNSMLDLFQQELVLANKDYTLPNIRTLLVEGAWDSDLPESFLDFLHFGVAESWQRLVWDLEAIIRECAERRKKTREETVWDWVVSAADW